MLVVRCLGDIQIVRVEGDVWAICKLPD